MRMTSVFRGVAQSINNFDNNSGGFKIGKQQKNFGIKSKDSLKRFNKFINTLEDDLDDTPILTGLQPESEEGFFY